jgi:hypothetical protein
MADKQNRPEETQRQNPNRPDTETQRREGQSQQGGQQRSGSAPERERTSREGAEDPRNKPEGNVEGTENR